MKLLFLFGNAAVGKMTVGQELMKLTGLRLFHNHMTIEPVIEIFGTYNSVAIQRLREVVFEEFSKSDCYGMIFTFMWAFDQQAPPPGRWPGSQTAPSGRWPLSPGNSSRRSPIPQR